MSAKRDVINNLCRSSGIKTSSLFHHAAVAHALLYLFPQLGTGDEVADVEDHESVAELDVHLDGLAQLHRLAIELVDEQTAIDGMSAEDGAQVLA